MIFLKDTFFKTSRIIFLFVALLMAQKSNALSIIDSTVFSKPVYLITWTDNDGKPRKVAMVKDIFPASTGVCVLIKYYDGNTPVTITSPTPYDDVNLGKPWNVGFGCTVHHGPSDTYHTGGTLTLTYQGPHMAIFTWVQTIKGAVETVTYTFLDGHDYFQWQETVNTAAATELADSRGPYCTMQWDGVDFSAVTGQEYAGEKYFVQNSYNGAWTLSGTADIPYVLEWDNSREVGYVQTQTFTQQMAGAPNWGGSWNLAASGPKVDGFGGVYNTPTAGDDDWAFDFQMNLYDGAKKITWGMPYGYMNNGNGTGTYNGNSTGNKNGWGQYSLSIVFDAQSEGGVKRVRDENRVIQNGNVSLTATNGTVMTTGPVGTSNPATQTLVPAGYDHNYRTWWVQADGTGTALLTMNVTSGSLQNPTFRVKNMTAVPSLVQYNGLTLTADVDYYASFNSSTGEAWVTILRSFSGSKTVKIVDGVSSGILITSATVTPSTVVNNVSNNLTFAVTATDDGSVASVKLDLSAIGGGSAVTMTPAGGNNYTLNYTLPAGASTGTKTIVATVTDNMGNTKTQNITLTVNTNVSYLNIYTDPSTMVTGTWNSNGTLTELSGAGAIEGSKDYNFNFTAVGWFAGFGLNLSNWTDAQAKDFSAYPTLELSYSGPNIPGTGIALTLAGVGSTQSVAYTLPASASYTTVQIPMSSFAPFDLTKIVGLNFSVTGTQSGSGSMKVDNIRLSNTPPLPVSLLYFNARSSGKHVQIDWATASEQDNLGFEIQRSADGTTFQPIGFVAGQNGHSLRNYSFTDETAPAGTSYYRLKQTDVSGAQTYSEIKSADVLQDIQVFYQYENRKIILRASMPEAGTFQVAIFDLQGKSIDAANVLLGGDHTEAEISFSGSEETLYLLQIRNQASGYSLSKKIIIR